MQSLSHSLGSQAEFLFRMATAADSALIIQMLKESADEQGIPEEFFTTEADLLRDIFGKTPKATILLVEKDRHTAAICVFFYNFASFIGRAGLYIEDIYVRPAFQGKGLGKYIITYMARYALQEGCGLLELLVLDTNTGAKEFYRKIGMSPIEGWKVNRIKGKQLEQLAYST